MELEHYKAFITIYMLAHIVIGYFIDVMPCKRWYEVVICRILDLSFGFFLASVIFLFIHVVGVAIVLLFY